jgi:hypothetical protein
MVNTLHSEAASPRPELEAQGKPTAARALGIAAKIRQSEAANETERSYFFRGFVIFLAIAAVFWIAVIGLIHLI